MTEDRIFAPFTPAQVEALNRYQTGGVFHPFTCPGNRLGGCQQRELTATPDGWVCQCGEYVQNWAHAFQLLQPEKLTLGVEDFEALQRHLDNPPEPSQALIDLMRPKRDS